MDWDNMLQTGVVSEALLKGLLEDHSKNYDILLRLMVKFGLVVPFRSAEERKKFLVPSLIPLSSSVNPLTTEKQNTFFIAFYNNASGSGEGPTRLETDFRLRGFLPNGLFEKLIGKVFDWSQQTSSNNTQFQLSRDRVSFFIGSQLFVMT